MSTLAEIQRAIGGLSLEERRALSVWLSSHEPAEFAPGEETVLLKSLDQGMEEIRKRKGLTVEDARKLVRHGLGNNFRPDSFGGFKPSS